ncbi:winged helix-turn-helix transcriptional regulator [Aquimarina gracilis]|uniref:Winged helix-turn-helix transcriptional regulator n=1 Tax=Aquimarina gracilis TaxID=874422 RepID=A0ABU5ZX77_9FLAO|nr:winged helix-turn-helix transcriptional regulator [Aquimarina gracilis]MEB3346447.1 winged helix-turn-helix transcriptional regulator [Aquimarina gracilis]
MTLKVYTKKPPLKVEYELTSFGQTLVPVLISIAEWGMMVTNEKGEIIANP